MSAHVLLNLINELENRDKMQDLPCILSLFRNEFNKFNKTGARLLGSKMTLKFHLGVKKNINLSLCTQQCCFSKICKPLVVYRLYCMH